MWNAVSRHWHVFWWLVAGAGVSLLIQAMPCWLNTEPGLGAARIFGGQEFLLTGMLVLVGSLVDWYCSDLRNTKRWVLTFFTAAPTILLLVAGFAYSELAKLNGRTPEEGTLISVSVLFGMSVLLGAFATWLEE